MKGWYKESHRHYLAAKGIKTSKVYKPSDRNWRLAYLDRPEPRYNHQRSAGTLKRDIEAHMDSGDEAVKQGFKAEAQRHYDKANELRKKQEAMQKGQKYYFEKSDEEKTK